MVLKGRLEISPSAFAIAALQSTLSVMDEMTRAAFREKAWRDAATPTQGDPLATVHRLVAEPDSAQGIGSRTATYVG